MEYLSLFFVVFVLFLTLSYELSQKCRYYMKFGIYYITGTVAAFILVPIFAVRGKNIRNVLLSRYLIYPVTHIIGIKWILRGEEHLMKDEASVIVANHQSSFDFLGMLKMWPYMDKCAAIAKKQLLYVFPFGLGAWYTGVIFIDRNKSKSAQNTMNEVVHKVKEDKVKMWVFPEGTRNIQKEHFLPFKKGAFHVAIDAQLPILPVVYSMYYFLDRKQRRFDTGKVIITTLPPIPTAGLTKDNIDELMEKVRSRMMEVYTATTEEAQRDEALLRMNSNVLNNGKKLD